MLGGSFIDEKTALLEPPANSRRLTVLIVPFQLQPIPNQRNQLPTPLFGLAYPSREWTGVTREGVELDGHIEIAPVMLYTLAMATVDQNPPNARLFFCPGSQRPLLFL